MGKRKSKCVWFNDCQEELLREHLQENAASRRFQHKSFENPSEGERTAVGALRGGVQ